MRDYCTELCRKRIDPGAYCKLCEALEERDEFLQNLLWGPRYVVKKTAQIVRHTEVGVTTIIRFFALVIAVLSFYFTIKTNLLHYRPYIGIVDITNEMVPDSIAKKGRRMRWNMVFKNTAPIRNRHGLPSGEILLDDVLSGKHRLIEHVRMSYQPSATLSQGWLGKVFGLKDKYNYEVELQLATNPKGLTPSFQPYFTMTVIKAD